MTISAEERSRINSQNGRKGGPRTPEGKRRSSQNAFKHGLRAETLCLPNEDPKELQAKLDEWHGFYQPRSPAEREFLNKAVLSLQQSDRLRRYQDATIADQVREAQHHWEDRREDEVARLASTLEADPATAVRKLKRTAAGCRWLLERWEPLKEHLDEYGWWTSPTLLHEATRLLGMRAENASTDADVYLLRLMNLSVETEKNRIILMQMVKPENVPDTLREEILGRPMKADYSRQVLAERVDGELAGLRELEEYLRVEFDEVSQAGAEDRAMVLEGEAGRLLHRYTVAAENAFHRAYQNFLKARAKEEDLIDEAPEITVPNEPNPEVASEPAAMKSRTCVEGSASGIEAGNRSKVERPDDSTGEPAAPLPNEPKSPLKTRGEREEIGVPDAAYLEQLIHG